MKALLTCILALAFNAAYADDAPVYTQAQLDAAWDREVAFAKSITQPHEPLTPEQKRLYHQKYLEYLREGAEEMRKNPNALSDEAEARRKKAAEIEAMRERIINYQPHGDSIPPTPEQAEFENQLADSLEVPREQLAAMYAADRAKLQESQALLKQVQQQYAESVQRVADERAAEEARRQRAAAQQEYEDRRRRNAEQLQERLGAIQRGVDELSRSTSQSADETMRNADARMADDVARVRASTQPVASAPPAPAARIPDPLAPDSAIQSEAARARKEAGTDLCPKEISDIECANRLEYVQEHARWQH